MINIEIIFLHMENRIYLIYIYNYKYKNDKSHEQGLAWKKIGIEAKKIDLLFI